MENFDDEESDPPSSESRASATSPEGPPDSNLEQLAQDFSAIRLSSAPRSSGQQQQGGTMQPQALTQTQKPTRGHAPSASQNDDSSTGVAETSSEGPEAAIEEHQEFNPEAPLKEETTSVPDTEQGESTICHAQHKLAICARPSEVGCRKTQCW